MIMNNIIGKNDTTKNFSIEKKHGKIIYRYDCNAEGIYGLGERYCSINHKGRTLVNRVFEQFTRQNENTYLPIPFFIASDGHGVFVDTAYEVTFHFEIDHNVIEIDEDAPHRFVFYYGTAKEIISAFGKDTGRAVLPPKWAFGVWASANRWNCQQNIEEQLDAFKKYRYPVSVIVIEAWSDEATFYIWNGAEYPVKEGQKGFQLSDFTFHEPWPDPKGMIQQIHEDGIRIVLWQIPALKELEEGRCVEQHDLDMRYAVEKNLVAKNLKGTPYQIPRQWFIGALLPDFSNPQTRTWWAEKRRYLLEDMGIDGFKTDGGEFVHDLDTSFYEGKSGREIRNLYPAQYEAAYHEMIGESRILFSRAGYVGAQKTPMHWAGDQLSTFEELRSVLNAGLSLAMSGVPFWSFDIAGFAGPLPDKELYLRASALAAFVPAMQWHSEPADGQFSEVLKGNGGTNDRSPWNMSLVTNDPEVLKTSVFFANLHMNFLPYFYSEARKAAEDYLPFMKHLMLEYFEDERAKQCDDQYMIGDLMIAPVLAPEKRSRTVYFPEGNWYNLWDGERMAGSKKAEIQVPINRIGLFLRENSAVLLNLGDTGELGSYVGNDVEHYQQIAVYCAGEHVNYSFNDEFGNKVLIKDSKIEVCDLNCKFIWM